MALGLRSSVVFILIQIIQVMRTQNATNDINQNVTTTSITTVSTNETAKKLPSELFCKFQANRYKCTQRTYRKYYFDLKLQRCERFDYGNCENTYNMFDGRHDCQDTCLDNLHAIVPTNTTANVYCRFQPEFGECHSYHPMFYYDISERRCKGFSFSGCGGNMNRFPSASNCMNVCGPFFEKE